MRLLLSVGILFLSFSINSISAQSLNVNHSISFTNYYSHFSKAHNLKGISLGVEYKNTLYKNFGLVASVSKRFITTRYNYSLICFCGPIDLSWVDGEAQIYNTDLGINYAVKIKDRHSLIISSGFHQRNITTPISNVESKSNIRKEVFNGYFSDLEYAFALNHFLSVGIKGKIQVARGYIYDYKTSINNYHLGTSISYLF